MDNRDCLSMQNISGQAYEFVTVSIDNLRKESPALQELSSVMASWGGYLDLYASQTRTAFFCTGTESMCVASVASALHRNNAQALSAVEMPDSHKDTKSGGTGRVDLWFDTGKHEFHVEGKLRRQSKKVPQLETTFVGKNGGSASSLISTGFRDFQKSCGAFRQIRRTNRRGFNRVMLLMFRFDYENKQENLDEACKEIAAIFKNSKSIKVYRNARTREEAKPVNDSMSLYDHVFLAMIPNGKVQFEQKHNVGFIAVASIIQTPRSRAQSAQTVAR